MKPLTNSRKKTRAAFTLIEMIGVLAVIAILAAVLIPKVFEAINNARVNNAAMSCQTVKTAVADHYAKYGGILLDGTTTPPTTLTPTSDIYKKYDDVLLKEGFLDKPFATKIGDGTVTNQVEVVDISPTGVALTLGGTVDETETTGFALSGGVTNSVVGSAMIQAVISGVSENDAKDLNDRIDGPSLGVALGSAPDTAGRVKYGDTFPTTVYVYLTHR